MCSFGPDLEIILLNVNIIYKIFVKILDSLLAHALKGTIFLRAAAPKAGLSGHPNFQQLLAVKRNKFLELDLLRYPHLNIGHVCGC